MLTYKQFGVGKPIHVYNDGQSVGRIVSVVEGWQYQPRKSKNHGEVFGSIAEVKASLA